MSAKETFDKAIISSERCILFYELLCNQRERRANALWMGKIKKLLYWNKKDVSFRIDSEHGVILIRNQKNFAGENFDHEAVSDLLRSAVVSAVSAMDKYMHDLILDKSLKIFGSDTVPTAWNRINIPAHEARKMSVRAKTDKLARTGTELKTVLQKALHNQTFQSPTELETAGGLLDIKNYVIPGVSKGFWNKVAGKMPGNQSGEGAKALMGEINMRRNQIVHEADRKRKQRGASHEPVDIRKAKAKNYVKFIHQFVNAIDGIADDIWP